MSCVMQRSGHRPATVLASFSPISGVNGLRRLLSGMCSRRAANAAAARLLNALRSCPCVAADRFVHSVGFAPEKLGCYAEKTYQLAVASCS